MKKNVADTKECLDVVYANVLEQQLSTTRVQSNMLLPPEAPIGISTSTGLYVQKDQVTRYARSTVIICTSIIRTTRSVANLEVRDLILVSRA